MFPLSSAHLLKVVSGSDSVHISAFGWSGRYATRLRAGPRPKIRAERTEIIGGWASDSQLMQLRRPSNQLSRSKRHGGLNPSLSPPKLSLGSSLCRPAAARLTEPSPTT